MARYWVSFRVNDSEKKATYVKRRQSIYDAMESMASKFWKETTSFIVFESELESTKSVTTHLTRQLLEGYDTVVVRKVDHTNCFIWGLIDDPDIFELMPTLQLLEG